MSIIAFIPSRYGSSRFPGKPLALIAGKPMIQRAYQCACACPDISDVYVATDDERILNCVEGFGGKAVMTGSEHQSGTDRIAEAVQKLGLASGDLIVNIQGDQPVFEPEIISAMVKPLIEDSSIPMSTLKYRIKTKEEIENSNIVKVVTDNMGFAIYFSRYPIPFYRETGTDREYYKHLGLYAYTKDFILEFTHLPSGRLEAAEKLEQLRALEHGYKIMVVDALSNSVEVDTPADIKKVLSLLEAPSR